MNKKLTLILLTHLVISGPIVTDARAASAGPSSLMPQTTTSSSSSSSSSSVDLSPERKLDILDQRFEGLCQQLGELMNEFESITENLASLTMLTDQSSVSQPAQQRLMEQVEEGAGAAASPQAALALSHTTDASRPADDQDTFVWDGKKPMSKNVRKVTMGDRVSVITPYAFAGCWLLESIIIPEGVTSISKYAFADCRSVKEIRIPSTVTSIGINAFIGCKSLEKIEIPKTLQGKISKNRLGVSSNCKFVCY